MTLTAQAGRKSWYVSATRGKRAFARAGTPKGNSRTSRSPSFPHLYSLRRATSRDAWRHQSWTGLQQRHTICIGARQDNYNSSLQGVYRFTHIMKDDAEHGYQQHAAALRHPAALGLWSTLLQDQSASWVQPNSDPREQLGTGDLEPPKGSQLQSRGRGHKRQPCVVINARRRATCEEFHELHLCAPHVDGLCLNVGVPDTSRQSRRRWL